MPLKEAPAWTPHNAPTTQTSVVPGQQLPIASSYALLRVPRSTAKAEENCVLVATWSASSIACINASNSLQPLFSSVPHPRTPQSVEEHILSSVAGCARGAHSLIKTFPVPLGMQWTVLTKEKSTSRGDGHSTLPARAIIAASLLSGNDLSPSASARCSSQFEKRVTLKHVHRLRLGPVLNASAWKALFTRQSRAAAPHALASTPDCLLSSDVVNLHSTSAQVECVALGEGDESTTTADREALAVLFPALHHGLYFATPDEFAQHCLRSDDHLLWCEDDPLMMVEWEVQREAEAMCADEELTSTACQRSAPSSPLRKRRRSWLERGVQRRANLLNVKLPSCEVPVDAREGDATYSVTAETSCVVTETHCAYMLVDVCSDGAVASSAPFVPPCGADGSNDVFVLLYNLLRRGCQPACELLMLSCKNESGGGSHARAADVRQAAALDVLLHGIVTSLAYWVWRCSAHEPILHISAATNAHVCSQLLAQWRLCFAREASQGPGASATPQQCPTRSEVAYGVDCAFYPHLRAEAALEGTPASFWARLAADCGIACARYRRSLDRKQLWCSVLTTQDESEAAHSSGAQSATEAAFDKCARDAESSRLHSSSCSSTLAARRSSAVTRLTRKETARQRDEYCACMHLVLQILLAEQQVLVNNYQHTLPV